MSYYTLESMFSCIIFSVFLCVSYWFVCDCHLGSTAVEAILQHYHTPSPARGHTSSSSSSFDHNSSTNKNSTSGQRLKCIMYECMMCVSNYLSVYRSRSVFSCTALCVYVLFRLLSKQWQCEDRHPSQSWRPRIPCCQFRRRSVLPECAIGCGEVV